MAARYSAPDFTPIRARRCHSRSAFRRLRSPSRRSAPAPRLAPLRRKRPADWLLLPRNSDNGRSGSALMSWADRLVAALAWQSHPPRTMPVPAPPSLLSARPWPRYRRDPVGGSGMSPQGAARCCGDPLGRCRPTPRRDARDRVARLRTGGSGRVPPCAGHPRHGRALPSVPTAPDELVDRLPCRSRLR